MTGPGITFRLLTPPPDRPAALAAVEVQGPDPDAALAHLGIRPVPLHAARLRTIPGVDQAVVLRPDARTAVLMPHASPAGVRLLLGRLSSAGFAPAPARADRPLLPVPDEISFQHELWAALASVHSPEAVDLLLAQPALWQRARARGLGAGDEAELRRSARVLRRLLDPPLVAAVGPPNVGKSTLLNAIARRRVALEADLPGSTRDAVGATVALAGLVVRWLDTPGLNPHAQGPDADAQRLARTMIGRADLIISCGDPFTPPPEADLLPPTIPRVDVLLRADLAASDGADRSRPATTAPHAPAVRISAARGEGLDDLAREVRAALLEGLALEPTPLWAFWHRP